MSIYESSLAVRYLQVRFCCKKTILILFMRAVKMSTEGDIRVAGQSKFHPMAPLNWMEARPAGPGRKGTLNRRASCPLVKVMRRIYLTNCQTRTGPGHFNEKDLRSAQCMQCTSSS